MMHIFVCKNRHFSSFLDASDAKNVSSRLILSVNKTIFETFFEKAAHGPEGNVARVLVYKLSSVICHDSGWG